jgi:hypothetical protein
MKCPAEIIKLVEIIDEKYREYKGEVSRFSIEWGTWSRKMNLDVRKKIETNHEYKTFYQYIYIYWVNRSQLIELNFGPWAISHGKKKKIAREGAKIKKYILSGAFPKTGKLAI